MSDLELQVLSHQTQSGMPYQHLHAQIMTPTGIITPMFSSLWPFPKASSGVKASLSKAGCPFGLLDISFMPAMQPPGLPPLTRAWETIRPIPAARWLSPPTLPRLPKVMFYS